MANNTTITMDSLKEDSVQVYDGMIAVYPQSGQEEPINVWKLYPKFNGCYAVNNSTVCFVSDKEVFVTPCTRHTVRTLRSAGFREEHFYVPFSNWDYPKNEMDRWIYLCNKARKIHEEAFVEDCIHFCDEHNIGTISEKTLQNCFEMPSTGVKVIHFYYEDWYYPIIKTTCFDSIASNYIGRFCVNNGKVVFVYRDGKTYVAKGYKILDELRSAGYTESGMFVPFSNGETIHDPILRERWESITKVS